MRTSRMCNSIWGRPRAREVWAAMALRSGAAQLPAPTRNKKSPAMGIMAENKKARFHIAITGLPGEHRSKNCRYIVRGGGRLAIFQDSARPTRGATERRLASPLVGPIHSAQVPPHSSAFAKSNCERRQPSVSPPGVARFFCAHRPLFPQDRGLQVSYLRRPLFPPHLIL